MASSTDLVSISKSEPWHRRTLALDGQQLNNLDNLEYLIVLLYFQELNKYCNKHHLRHMTDK